MIDADFDLAEDECPWGQPLVWSFGPANAIVVKNAMIEVERSHNHYQIKGRLVACKICQGYHVIFDEDERDYDQRRERFSWRSKAWD